MEIAAITAAILFGLVAVFQVLLAFGFPLGEAAMGGSHRVLPANLRAASALNALLLIFMAGIVLQHAFQFSDLLRFLPTTILMWVIIIFMGINTLMNLISRSKKERLIMTPVSGLLFILCLWVV
ncbi:MULTISPECIES: hypothetical protein [Halobacillus]|uniref:hypothetical protein n=1 Tax=Halobacillus TaxID=45667 RepID=UPI00040886E7|nr:MULTISPECIES: hypothetical protein [Halobacillus]MCA1023740.1 hypothetical protein [Halobacillus litoralis]MYL39153.1 hypothetical protein [Halobacillus litoralis]